MSTFRGIKTLDTYLRILANPTHPKNDEAVLINGRDSDVVQRNGGFLEQMLYLCTLSKTPTENIMQEIVSRCPLWRINNICDELFTVEKGSISAAVFRRIYENHKRIHRYTISAYTDGSKTRERVALAFRQQQMTVQRIQAHASEFTAELYAIYYSLNYIQGLPPSPVTICFDSKSAIMGIVSLNSEQLIRSRIAALDRQIKVC